MGAGWDPVLFVGTGIGKHKTGWVDAVLLLPAWSASVADSFNLAYSRQALEIVVPVVVPKPLFYFFTKNRFS